MALTRPSTVHGSRTSPAAGITCCSSSATYGICPRSSRASSSSFPNPWTCPGSSRRCGRHPHACIGRKGIAFIAEVDPRLDAIVLDPVRLKQVLYDFLSNAIKFTPNAVRVTVRATANDEGYFLLEVEDTGIGIAAGHLPRLFTEFEQIDAGRDKQHPGTGLGLALTRRLVEAQGGSVGGAASPARAVCSTPG